MGHDFDGVAAAALASAFILLPRWMGGRQQGTEWVGERKANGGIGDSWSVNIKTGTWKHFAGNVSGKDLISLYAALFHMSQNAARIEIERQLGANGNDVPVLPARAPEPDPQDEPDPVELIPHDAPALANHPTYGPATAEYRYGDHLVVQRFDYRDEEGEPAKTFRQWSWHRGAWRNRGVRGPLPLYHAHLIKASPTSPVLVVEGEKCVELAQPMIRSWILTTWAGGTGGFKKADWSILEGRDVAIWPDADKPGRDAGAAIAAMLAGSAARVRAVNPNGADPGWDVGEAIESGWDHAKLTGWLRDHMGEAIEGPKAKSVTASAGAPPSAVTTHATLVDDEPSIALSYEQMGLDVDNHRIPFVTLANASKILQRYVHFRDRIWFDEFRGCVYHTLRSEEPQQWTDRDTRQVTVAIQQRLQLHKFHLDLIRMGITHAAECNARHSLTLWLDSLCWDGEPRLDTWLADCAGVEYNDYSQAIARNWLIAMVARAYKPGCKMDNIPVLEGVSGLSKTQFLEILGGEWYEALPMEFGTKDFLQALQGVWLAEIPDMTGFDRADHSRVISLLSIPRDKYRKSYGYEPERFKRTTVFAATSETDDYLMDRRGKRRFWPLRCRDIDLDTLRGMREQLFAEAVHCFRANEAWFKVPASAMEEQEARISEDVWTSKVLDHADSVWKRSAVGLPEDVTTSLIMDMLALPANQQTRREQMRIGDILKANGWVRRRNSRHWYWRKLERSAG